MDLTLFKHVRRAAWVGIAAIGAWIGWMGIHRSLWLDEAWVANSVRVRSIWEMYWGGEWLQTSPPLFLAIDRVVVSVFGSSTEVFRTIPLLFALLAGVAMAGAAKRMGPLAVAALLFPTVAVEYFTSFKQYGAEAAAVAVVLWATVEYRRLGFVLYFSLVALLLTLAYPLAFLLPGLAIFLWKEEGLRKALMFGAGCGAVLAALYFGFVRPNVEPSLWTYWSDSAPYAAHVWWWLAASFVLLFRAVGLRRYVEIACLLPCLLFVAAEVTGWYPASPRTSLFVRPCFVLALVMFVDENLPREWRWEWVPLAVALGIAVNGAMHPIAVMEDYPAAVSYLREHVGPGDLLVVHPDAREGLKLYGADLDVRYGATGWPCCLRGRIPERSAETAVRADMDRLVPEGYTGRVWLFYANRPLHWEYIGLNEGELWRKILWDRGCPPGDYVALPNLVVSPMVCGAR